MSEDDLRRAKCNAKIAYDSAADARKVTLHLKRPHRHFKAEGPHPEPYRCQFCDKFHLGRDYIAARRKRKAQ